MRNTGEYCMYYTAIVCPPELDQKILQFKFWMQEQFGCTVALKSPAHLTLIPPFWLEQKEEALLLQTTSSFEFPLETFDICLDNFAHFSNRVIFISIKPNDSLNALRQKAEQHFINKLGDSIKKETRPFTPHITIANRDLKPGDFIKAWNHFSRMKYEESFKANQISLLKLTEGKWNVIAFSDFPNMK